MLRVITGTAKGKKLITLEGEATRPTSERIKEAVFSSIQFDVENRRVLDLFAGSGQLVIEALSRGAESVTFVDAMREAMDDICALRLYEDRFGKEATRALILQDVDGEFDFAHYPTKSEYLVNLREKIANSF